MVEPKVKASTAGALVAAVVIWLLGHYLFHGTAPAVVTGWVEATVPPLVALAAGWLAKHYDPPPPAGHARAPARTPPAPPAPGGPAAA